MKRFAVFCVNLVSPNRRMTIPTSYQKNHGDKSLQNPDKNQEDGSGASPSPSAAESRSSPSIYSLFDANGRMNIFRLRQLVYEKGTHPSERKITWKFLFGVYSEKSTTEERQEMDQRMISQYRWMKYSWKQRFPWATNIKVHSDLEFSLAIQKYKDQEREFEAAKPLADAYIEHSLPFQYINEQLFQKALRDIDADIPRTDRHRTFFQREGLVKLLYLRDILITYTAFHQDIGYCQGMNDFASRFLETLDNETDAFWCFVGYMRRSAWSFTTLGVRRKIQICEEILKHVDSELYNHIESVTKEKLFFCLRWLMLRFQKDLDTSDAIRVLEISALEAEKVNFAPWIWLTRREGEEAPDPFPSVERDEITFEVLLCIAVLIQNRKQLLQYQDVNDFFLFAQRLQGRLQLNTLHGEE
ncbi:TBC1 domain family member 15-like isoform X2 [Heteronotia binoei]|uniref:TBC1 domain family member 15-like isoform X2 n=1 Tax=Heteronotia binoei TaxID=13085 RepID=UPI00292D259F|nr:TBC1 domain family member 15-like isoform X2 [Heteronotia binoei]